MVTGPQVDHWRGQFGDEYTARNQIDPERLRRRMRFWAGILERLGGACGFSWKRTTGFDNLTWWLFRKVSRDTSR